MFYILKAKYILRVFYKICKRKMTIETKIKGMNLITVCCIPETNIILYVNCNFKKEIFKNLKKSMKLIFKRNANENQTF